MIKLNNTQILNRGPEIRVTRAELDRMLERYSNPALVSEGKETVIWNKDSLMNQINSHLDKAREDGKFNPENVKDLFSRYQKWQKDTEGSRLKHDEIWDKVRKESLIKDIINKDKELTNSNILEYNEFIHANKETFVSELNLTKTLAPNKPLGSLGEITINEFLTKGFELIDTPLVQMIRENVDVSVVGSFFSSMILYKTVLNLYMKHTYSNPNVLQTLGGSPSTRVREITFFMIVGAPMVVGALMGINWATAGKTKVILKIAENTDLEGASSISSSSSFFLFLNKLPSWLKAVLKYIALYFILWFIVSVIGYNSNIIQELSSQFYFYLVYFLKFWTILNFLVVIYYILRLYVLKMYANNKEFINPEDYPKFIKNELIEWKNIATKLTQIELANFYKHCYFLIILYISIVLLGLTGTVIVSIYLIP
jgi:hypothetical protein